MPPTIDAEAEAECLLVRAAELVPEWLPVTTLVLGRDNQEALRRLIRGGRFGAVVAGPPPRYPSTNFRRATLDGMGRRFRRPDR